MDEAALLGLGSQADPQAQQRALQYFEQLKASDNGWELCADALLSASYSSNDHVKFFCMQVIEFHMKEKYKNGTADMQQKTKNFLLSWLQNHCQNPSKNPTFVCNKAAQLFCLAFVDDYPTKWPTFFVDLLTAAAQQGVPAVWIYLRVLMAIDTEVVDREIAHSDPEYQRNTLLKDAMREHSVAQMVDSWYHIITTYDASHPEMTCFCLCVIGAYVAWIDINLIANDKFVPVLLRFMTMPLLRESTCDCIHEIISKGMDPIAKTRLIESFTSVLATTGCFDVNDDEDGDYLAKLAKLINGIGLQLTQSWQKLMKAKDVENAKLPLEALEGKMPLMLKFLASEDDDVSGAVIQMAHDYLTTLKQLTPLSEARSQVVKEMLFVIIEKMKYDDGYNFAQEGEDEAMFDEYRKELKVILNNMGGLDSTMFLATIQELCSQTFANWRHAKFQDVEVALTLLYQLAEALPASHGQHFSGDPNKSTAIQDMMKLMITSKVCCYQHQAVQLQYFENIVRYDKFFNIDAENIPEVLIAFLDERGLRNPSTHVLSRTAYLFSRFVKGLNKQQLAGYLDDLLTRIHDLLVLHSPDNGHLKQHLSPDDQLFIYETAGILIVHSQFPPEKKALLMRQLLEPIVTKFEGLLTSMLQETDENTQQLYAECISHALSFASRTSKAFSANQTMKQCGCVEVYTETLKLFLHALNTPVHRTLLHTGVRQFLHRMVVCLDVEILPFIPPAVDNLLKVGADAKELHDFMPLINQLIMKFKKHIVPFLGSVFVPLVTRIFSVLSAPADERDQVAATERRMLQRSYFSFLAALVNNDVAEVLSMQEPSDLHQVLVTVIQGAVDIPDPQGQKVCYGILRRLIEIWAGKEGGMNGFADYVYDSIVPACFLGPLKPSFDMSDAQTVLVLSECAMCLKTVLDKRGEELVIFLQTKYLPSLNLSPELCQEFCQALSTADKKMFKNYFKSFFMRAKT